MRLASSSNSMPLTYHVNHLLEDDVVGSKPEGLKSCIRLRTG